METTRTVHTLRPGFVLLVLLCTFCGCWGYRAVRAALAAPVSEGGASGGSDAANDIPLAGSSPKTAPWNLILVNADHPLPESYAVSLTQLRNDQQADERMYPALQEMMDDARAAGLSPLICSSYRSRVQQQALYAKKVWEYLSDGLSREEAETTAARWVSAPGTSEHETGLAVDIVAESYQTLDSAQADTAEQQWLLEHCWEYGFILRYPAGKTDITGVEYEPWHYRYVGVSAAMDMRDSGQCLEEYLNEAS